MKAIDDVAFSEANQYAVQLRHSLGAQLAWAHSLPPDKCTSKKTPCRPMT